MKTLVSSVRIEIRGGHAHIGVWSRGGKAGTLVVDKDDAFDIAMLLVGEGVPIYFDSWKWELDCGMWYGENMNHPQWLLRVNDNYIGWSAMLDDGKNKPELVMHGPHIKDATKADCFTESILYIKEVEENKISNCESF